MSTDVRAYKSLFLSKKLGVIPTISWLPRQHLPTLAYFTHYFSQNLLLFLGLGLVA